MSKLNKIFVQAALYFMAQTHQFAFANASDIKWSDRLTRKFEDATRVYFYCTDYQSATRYLERFMLMTGPVRTMFYVDKDKPPKLSDSLSNLLALKRVFKPLTKEELLALNSEQQQAYVQSIYKLNQLQQFLDYMKNKKCFWHNQTYSFMFSIARKPQFIGEHFVTENGEKTQKWKVDIYKAEMDFGSYSQAGFIHIGPCRVREIPSGYARCPGI